VRHRPKTLRDSVVLVFGAIGVGLLPWSVWISATLKPHHTTNRWDLAWSGFDAGLALCFGGTALAAWRRSPWVAPLAAATGTLLLTDAWFDVVLESHGNEQEVAVFEAVFFELPVAALCFWIAHRAERFLKRVLREGLHLAATGQRSAEGHFVGIFEIPADRQPAGEAGDSNTTA
jgi:hypothetical protein